MCQKENDYSDGYYEGFYYDERDDVWYPKIDENFSEEQDDDYETDNYPDFSDK